MARSTPVLERLGRRLAWHQALHDPAREPRNTLRWLQELRRWQSQRLEHSFEHFLEDPQRRPAAMFFLTDVYGDRDFSRRDADIVKVLPMMQRLMPASLLDTVADGIELGALTHALDLRMAEALQSLAPRRKRLDEALYAEAYRQAGLPRLRQRQIDLIARVGLGLAKAVHTPGVRMLLRFARGPAKAAGLSELQGFLERGFDAFSTLGDAEGFIGDIESTERAVSRRLFAGDPDPFALE
ncbi:FFLEELY motif protein [Xanthomonas rydalmerensis]|uniref:DUF8198 domain-containing protein n=1 Tax=Xanthomonas rydalmerensis TaxID=3046274 RepID=A0ABZ0JS11_9XANT|nr:hypothetical protein [Xanthomonas sp. DM-2023]WOS42619.1 hypothetical protein QN243_09335 [Xanthomonas sp. DM-2023]WOS46805.1 hypothetical protein QN242_09335 [Xanthomonas sp. DM-2023]WOS50985.1 hypothetical protein QN240_09335 [Xanthomonas sp. DM-2023]WOS55165.1 hypothetical protein QN244_09335 [Xanthomonas sp. DM-2023]WOS59347.1 hypothetical protein QN245_09335 [Xanthomonas sp. DM-2023]